MAEHVARRRAGAVARLLLPITSGLFALALAVSCASAPESEPEEAPKAEPAPAPAPTTEPAPDSEKQQAERLRATVSRFELSDYDPEDFASAEASYQKAEGLYGKDNAGAKESYQAAITDYRKVIDTGFSARTRQRRTGVEKIKNDAEALKAPVASPQEYTAAETAYREAVALEQSGEFEKALDGYEKAQSLFEEVYSITAEKKRRAEQAMAEAQAGIENYESTARELEGTSQSGGSR